MKRTSSSTYLPSLREVFAIALPQLGLMLCYMAISMTDLWVATQLDASILASLGLVGQVFMLLMLVTSVVSSGCMSTISKALGAGRLIRAQHYAFLTLSLAIMAGCIVACTGMLFIPIFISLMLPESSNAAVASSLRVFLWAYCCHIPFFYAMVIMNSIFRAHKLVWIPFMTLVLVMLVNTLGSLGFGLGLWALPKVGVYGVAWSTFASGLVGALCNACFICKRKLLGSRPKLRWIKVGWVRLFRIGGPATLAQVSGQLGTFVIMLLLVSLPIQGENLSVIAGMTLGTRVMGFIQFPFAAFAMALTIFSGYLLGEKNYQACHALGGKFIVTAGFVMVFLALSLFIFQDIILSFFVLQNQSDMTQILEQAKFFLIFACFLAPFQVIAMMLNAAFAGAGTTYITCKASVLGMWFITLPLAYILGYALNMGVMGIYVGMTGGTLVSFFYAFFTFSQKKWLS